MYTSNTTDNSKFFTLKVKKINDNPINLVGLAQLSFISGLGKKIDERALPFIRHLWEFVASIIYRNFTGLQKSISYDSCLLYLLLPWLSPTND